MSVDLSAAPDHVIVPMPYGVALGLRRRLLGSDWTSRLHHGCAALPKIRVRDVPVFTHIAHLGAHSEEIGLRRDDAIAGKLVELLSAGLAKRFRELCVLFHANV